MTLENKNKKPPKGAIKFNITLSEEQKQAKEHIMNHAFSFVVGKAGSGKTLLGFLPGTEKEKLEPWLVPIMSNMRKVYNKPDKLKNMVENEEIELVSLTHFRGRTFDNAIVIVDEFQNLTKAQLRMALGRLGKKSVMILCGDNQQVDLKDRYNSAIDDISKVEQSKYVYKVILEDNHRHEALDDVLKLLTGY